MPTSKKITQINRNNIILKKQFIEIILFGIISGMPFSILYTALIIWCTEYSIPLSLVTSIAIARIPYGFKYLWAPVVDGFKIPFLSFLGQRKSWMFFTIILNSLILFTFSFINPKDNFTIIYFLAIGFGFLSATYDIAFDGFRVYTVKPESQGYAASCAVLGYRIGMLISSAGALYVSAFVSWSISFVMLASILLISLVFIPMLHEEVTEKKEYKSFIQNFKTYVIEPFYEFLTRKNAILILIGIILYKLGGVLLGIVNTPFLLEIGYSKVQIASIVKVFGLGATLLGSFFGGIIVARLGNLKGLIAGSLIQAFVHGIFIWLHHTDTSNTSLIIAIGIENFGSAAGTTAEVAYISYLCNRSYSATQYALLSSLASLANSIIGVKSGALVGLLGWDIYFLATVLLSLPSTLIFLYLIKSQSKLSS